MASSIATGLPASTQTKFKVREALSVSEPFDLDISSIQIEDPYTDTGPFYKCRLALAQQLDIDSDCITLLDPDDHYKIIDDWDCKTDRDEIHFLCSLSESDSESDFSAELHQRMHMAEIRCQVKLAKRNEACWKVKFLLSRELATTTSSSDQSLVEAALPDLPDVITPASPSCESSDGSFECF